MSDMYIIPQRHSFKKQNMIDCVKSADRPSRVSDVILLLSIAGMVHSTVEPLLYDHPQNHIGVVV